MERRRTLVAMAVLALHVLLVLLLSLERPQPTATTSVVTVGLVMGSPEPPAQRAPPVPVDLARIPVLIVPLPLVVTEVPTPPEQQSSQSKLELSGTGAFGTPPLASQTVDYLRQPQLIYPPKAKRRHEEGMVLVLVLVGADGLAKDARVYRSSGHPMLDDAALDAVFNALFRPRIENGVARAVRIIVPFNFSLSVPPGG
jgi:protein TonB